MTNPLLTYVFTFALCLCAALTSGSLAVTASEHNNTPPPPRKTTTLSTLNHHIKQLEHARDQSETASAAIEGDLKTQKSRLVSLSRQIQAHESKMLTLEQTLETTEKEHATLDAKLQRDKVRIADLIIAMDAIGKAPMIAMMLSPEAPLETAQTAIAIDNISQNVTHKAETLQQDTHKLEKALLTLTQSQAALKNEAAQLKQAKQKLTTYMRSQEKRYTRSQQDIAEKTKQIQAISARSKTMKELLDNLKTTPPPPTHKKSNWPFWRKPAQSTTPGFQKPLAGKIRVSYGHDDHLQAKSKGLWIEGRSGSLIVAPMEGRVRFVGTFKTYGNIVIIEHTGGYHSLIAGMEQITVKIESKVAKGEPIGYLKKTNSDIVTQMIYFELRLSGKAINPEKKLSAL